MGELQIYYLSLFEGAKRALTDGHLIREASGVQESAAAMQPMLAVHWHTGKRAPMARPSGQHAPSSKHAADPRETRPVTEESLAPGPLAVWHAIGAKLCHNRVGNK